MLLLFGEEVSYNADLDIPDVTTLTRVSSARNDTAEARAWKKDGHLWNPKSTLPQATKKEVHDEYAGVTISKELEEGQMCNGICSLEMENTDTDIWLSASTSPKRNADEDEQDDERDIDDEALDLEPHRSSTKPDYKCGTSSAAEDQVGPRPEAQKNSTSPAMRDQQMKEGKPNSVE